jgi:DNA invertase Pin-like site-specific DNA recombinase
MNLKLTAEHLSRRAIVYVRQSSPGQVINNQESQRRQYGLAERARELGFEEIVVIDDDLGRSGSGLIERPGFQRLVAEVCSGEVGAVFCIEASRLARNGRDWHHLIELCGMVRAVIVDPDGVYDPVLVNDRLLLGLKGTMSEFELNLLRQRSVEAIRQKASRGELRYVLAIGYIWTSSEKIEKHPDLRVQQALSLVFAKMVELGSARQVLLWFRRERVCLPVRVRASQQDEVSWQLPVYNTVHKILTNPIYAGAYVFGKTEVRTKIINGRARKTSGHHKPQEKWSVLIRDHHSAYIPWEQYERNQAMIAANTHMRRRMEVKAGRGGSALLSGLLRCRRCGRMLQVSYSGTRGNVVRYHCKGAHINHGTDWCISFGGFRTDQSVSKEILRVISGDAVEAALEAAQQAVQQRSEQRRTVELALGQACYEAQLAARRYAAVDPDNRLVAAELELRWNAELEKVKELDRKLHDFDLASSAKRLPDRETLLSLAHELPVIWNSAATEMRLKQRIVRILIREIVADVDDQHQEIVLLIHWAGGRHSELRVKKNKTGRHERCTAIEAVEVVRQMAGKFTDAQIASTLNRLGLRTGAGNSWNESRVSSLRRYQQLPAYDAAARQNFLTLEQAAEHLGVSATTVRRMINLKLLPGDQVIEYAPWQIPKVALASADVKRAVQRIKQRVHVPPTHQGEDQHSLFSKS